MEVPAASNAQIWCCSSAPARILPASGPNRAGYGGTTIMPSRWTPTAAMRVGTPAEVMRHTSPTVVTTIRSPPNTPVRSTYSDPRIRPWGPAPGSVTHGLITVAPLSVMRAI